MQLNQTILNFIFLALLTLQNSSQELLSRYSRGILKESYSPGLVVFLSEITKCVISIIGTYVTRHKETNIVQHIKTLIKTSLVSSVPALIYFFQNLLHLISYENIPAELHAVLSQLKILTSAILSVMIIKKKLTSTQWRALITLIVSVIIVEGASRKEMQDDQSFTMFNYIIGVSCCLLACTASGFSGVYMELVLKNKLGNGPKLNLWERNFQLSMYSIVFAIINLTFSDGKNILTKGLFHDFTILGCGCVLLMSIGGILVALILTYADVIVKGFSVSVSIICTTIGAWILFGSPITFEFILGAIGVIISISNYNDKSASWAFQNPEIIGEDVTVQNTVLQSTQPEVMVRKEEKQIELIPLEDIDGPQVEVGDAAVVIEDVEN